MVDHMLQVCFMIYSIWATTNYVHATMKTLLGKSYYRQLDSNYKFIDIKDV